MNSIERVDFCRANRGETVQWQLIELPENVISPRSHVLFTSLNERELVIIGGQDEEGDPMSETNVFDTHSFEAKRVVSNALSYRVVACKN